MGVNLFLYMYAIKSFVELEKVHALKSRLLMDIWTLKETTSRDFYYFSNK